MKKISLLLIVLAILLVPFTTVAKSKKVNVYFFRGEGCSHCAEAEEFFKSIEAEYGKYYKLVDYEVWHNQDNASLMEQVAEARGDEAGGVPYIIIGDKSWNGYASDYADSIKKKIKDVYNQKPKDRYDVMDHIKDGKGNKNYFMDIIISVLVVAVVAGAITGLYFIRRFTK